MDKINLKTADWCEGMSPTLKIATLFRELKRVYEENNDLTNSLIEAGYACEYCGATAGITHKGYCPDGA